MPDSVSPVTQRCKICGGKLVNHYLAGSCVCANCGNKWSLEEIVPNYSQYGSVISLINEANDTLASNETVIGASQAMLLYKSALAQCALYHDAVGAELVDECKKGQALAEKVKIYAGAKDAMNHKNYRKAESEFAKIPDFRDTEELAAACKKAHAAARLKMIPLDVVIGAILPAVLCIFLYLKFSLHLGIIIPIGIAFTALLAFVLYLDTDLSTVVKVLTFLVSVPFTIFLVLFYGFDLPAKKAAISAIAAPIVIIFVVAIMPERSQNNGAN